MVSKMSNLMSKLGRVYINCTKNNLLFTITNSNGNVCLWSSSGAVGFKHKRKKTSLAFQTTVLESIAKIKILKFKFIIIFLKQLGFNLDLLIKLLNFNFLIILRIYDVTPIAFNGCRVPKKRKI